MSFPWPPKGQPWIEPLNKRQNSQNHKILCPFPFELLAIRNSVLDYPKNWLFLCFYTETLNKFYYRSEFILTVIECAAEIQKKFPVLRSVRYRLLLLNGQIFKSSLQNIWSYPKINVLQIIVLPLYIF